MRAISLVLAMFAILCGSTWSSQAAEMRAGYYAHYLLVYGNGWERHATGCLRWHWQNRSWYDHCGPARNVVVTKY